MSGNFPNFIYKNLKKNIQLWTIFCISCNFLNVQAKYLEDNYPATVIEDANLDTVGIQENN